jgi:hypothetical protein
MGCWWRFAWKERGISDCVIAEFCDWPPGTLTPLLHNLIDNKAKLIILRLQINLLQDELLA